MATAVARLGVELSFDDGTSFIVNEGDIVTGLVYKKGKDQLTIDEGRVRVICARTAAYSGGPDECPPESYMAKFITVTQLIVDYSDENYAKIARINVNDLVTIETVTNPADISDENTLIVGPGPEFKGLDEVIAAAPEDATICLEPGTYDVPLNISKSVTILGSVGTVLTSPIIVDSGAVAAVAAEGEVTTPTEPAPISVIIDGVTLTGAASINVVKADTFSMTNCTMENLEFSGTKGYPIRLGEVPMLVTIDHNTFNKNAANSYNGIECNAILKDGSSFSNNYFNEGCWTHNSVNVYNAEDGATVHIDNNYYAPGVDTNRLGYKGNVANATLTVSANKCESGFTNEWVGLLCIQPYGSKTESMKGITVKMDDNECYSTQLAYLYAGSKDMQWTDDNMPTVMVNGKVVAIPSDLCALLHG